MTDKKPSKPITLEDYIPPKPQPAPRAKTRRRDLSEQERARLGELEDALDKDAARPKKKKRGFWTIVIWIIALIVIANWLS